MSGNVFSSGIVIISDSSTSLHLFFSPYINVDLKMEHLLIWIPLLLFAKTCKCWCNMLFHVCVALLKTSFSSNILFVLNLMFALNIWNKMKIVLFKYFKTHQVHFLHCHQTGIIFVTNVIKIWIKTWNKYRYWDLLKTILNKLESEENLLVTTGKSLKRRIEDEHECN